MTSCYGAKGEGALSPPRTQAIPVPAGTPKAFAIKDSFSLCLCQSQLVESPRIRATDPPRTGAQAVAPPTAALAQHMDTHTFDGIDGVQAKILIQYYPRLLSQKDSPLVPPGLQSLTQSALFTLTWRHSGSYTSNTIMSNLSCCCFEQWLGT